MRSNSFAYASVSWMSCVLGSLDAALASSSIFAKVTVAPSIAHPRCSANSESSFAEPNIKRPCRSGALIEA